MKFPLIKRANITPSAAEGESFHQLIVQKGVGKAAEGLSQADLTSYYLSYNAYLASEVDKGAPDETLAQIRGKLAQIQDIIESAPSTESQTPRHRLRRISRRPQRRLARMPA